MKKVKVIKIAVDKCTGCRANEVVNLGAQGNLLGEERKRGHRVCL